MAPADPAVASAPKQPHIAAKQLALEYRGFRNADDRREYKLFARVADETREFTVWIAHAAFAAGHVHLQDGPDICYQKVWRLLLTGEPVDKVVEVAEAS